MVIIGTKIQVANYLTIFVFFRKCLISFFTFLCRRKINMWWIYTFEDNLGSTSVFVLNNNIMKT